MADYFEIGLSDARIQRVEEQVAFQSMKSTTQTEHVRKGVVGNWKTELPEAIANEATAMLTPLLDLLGYQNPIGELSAFLTDGELTNEILAVLAQINELQTQAGIQAAPRRNQAPAAPTLPGRTTGWR
jgi:hypothetical protein